MAGKNEIDMLNGRLTGKLIKVALPLAAISILQQLFNAADVAVVGRFGSENALAAVGANVTIVNMFLTFFGGLATGGNVCLSMLIGKGEKEKISDAVHTIISLGLISAVFVVLLGQLIAAPLLSLMKTPDAVFSQAELYLRIYLFAMMFAVIYNFAAAILRSKGDTKRPLYALIISGVLNVLLNLLFVIGFGLDVAGVGLATVISNALCAFLTLGFLLRERDLLHLSFSKLRIRKDPLLLTLRIGLPTGIQGSLFSISNMIIQTGINSFGAECIAGNTAAANFEFMTYFIVNAFAQTATTFISQNFGANKKDRCRKVFRLSMGLAIAFSMAVGLCFLLGSRFWLGFFTESQAVYDYAYIRMYCVVALEFVTSFNEIGAAGLRGRGISIVPMVITIMGTCVFRIIWSSTIFVWFRSIRVLMIVYPVSWVFLAITMLTAYFIVVYREEK